MQEQFKNKRVPWSDLEEYLAAHQSRIATFLEQLKADVVTKEDIEDRLPKSIWYLHELIVKILKANNILPDEEKQKAD